MNGLSTTKRLLGGLLGVCDKICEWCPVEAKKIPVFRKQIPVSGLTGICLQAIDMLHQIGWQ